MKYITLLLVFLILNIDMAASSSSRAQEDSFDRPQPSKARYVGIGDDDIAAFTFGPAFSKYYKWCMKQGKSCNILPMKDHLKKNIQLDEELEDCLNEFRASCIGYYSPPEEIIQEMFNELLEEVKNQQQTHLHSYNSTSGEEDEALTSSGASTPERPTAAGKGKKQA